MTDKRLDNLDFLKFIAMLMVLCLHVPLWQFNFIEVNSIGKNMQYAFRLLSEGVPLFIMVNGILLLKKEELIFKKHMKKILAIFRVFMIWGAFYVLFNALLQVPIEKLTIINLLGYVLRTTVGSQYTGVLWFLENLIGLYLWVPIIHKLYKDNYSLYKYIFIIVSAFTIGINTIELLRDFLAVNQLDVGLINDLIYFAYRFNIFDYAWFIFYFMLGGMIWHYSEIIVKNRTIFAITGFVAWGLAFYMV